MYLQHVLGTHRCRPGGSVWPARRPEPPRRPPA